MVSHLEASKAKRDNLIDHQLRQKGISDTRVLEAMKNIPREDFVPPEYESMAYRNGPLPIGEGQTISQPYIVALMTQCLELKPDDKVLEIGTGSGYQMAVLLEMGARVYSVERIPELASRAENILRSLGYKDVHIKRADGTEGWPEEAPFDAILVTSGAPSVPEPLKQQLADGGRLVIPVGSPHSQRLYKIVKTDAHFTTIVITPCVFVPLIGKYGWDGDQK